MKGTFHAQKNLVRGSWSLNSRIRNNHSGSRWLRWSATGDTSIRGSSSDVARDNPISIVTAWKLDAGSVTAEFAIVLPAVILILVGSLQVLSFQSSRVALIQLASESARALARGEDTQVVQTLISESSMQPAPTLIVEHKDLQICVTLSQARSIAGLGHLDLSEKQCARKDGL